MPRSKPDQDFKIYVDSSCLNTPMDEETISLAGDVEKNNDSKSKTQLDDEGLDNPVPAESSNKKSSTKNHDSTVDMTNDTDELRPSIETDDDSKEPKDDEIGDSSILSDRTDDSFHPDDGDQSYVHRSELDADNVAPRGTNTEKRSSQHEGTDEDVFTDKSSRSSMGSYDASSDCGKRVDPDGSTIITRSPRISDISQYDKEDFVPTARGTPRPPFRTPSDVRAMQMSSPAGSVVGSPRSSRKHFHTGSRLGTPSASAQYSPKRKSTPPRFKSRQEAPLVLLHVTLLPLRWMWGDLLNNLDPIEMSEQVKTLRSSWRILQDRVGDTVVERGILLGHPQNDYEVLEERVLEALELPVRRRARILECGHYLGPSNETTITEDEEECEDEHSQHRRHSDSKRHWCATCKSEIQYDALGESKVFRVKVYASNGLMRAGAWEACWKEMERVDVELEPIVEPTVQDEIVRLAAAQQEREIAQQEEADIAKEVALQFEEQRRSEEKILRQQEQARSQSSSPPTPEVIPEAVREHTRESRSPRRRHLDEERLREIYGDTPPPRESHSRQPSSHRYRDPEISTPPPRSPEKEVHEKKENRSRGYQSASLSELLMQSARVLMQDRKNVIIFTLGLFVLILSLRRTPPESTYEPIIYRLKNMPEVQQLSTVDTPPVVAPEQQRPMEPRHMESIVTTPSFELPDDEPSQANPIYQEASPSYEAPHNEPSQPNFDYEELLPIIEQQPVVSASQAVSEPTQDTFTAPASIATVYEPCRNPTVLAPLESTEVLSPISDAQVVENPAQEIVEETVHEMVEEIEITTERKVVKVVQTVTRTQTQTQTQTEIQTEVEMATAVETVLVEATEVPQLETSSDVESDVEEEKLDMQDDAALVEEKSPNDEIGEAGPQADSRPDCQADSVPDAMLETEPESLLESVAEPTVEPEEVPIEA
ncbi:hypothetical protein FHL15_010746 [Xylaria flabelliformis]|uniref:Pathway-specific nitrogen regulator n=1 Tax=Xylaria flabelliformis TaxID=2512241 RepID=A0A553HK98_9PEZI|nr:hypothetical protein FHL15_010746 [Xylaria flabelliformis]